MSQATVIQLDPVEQTISALLRAKQAEAKAQAVADAAKAERKQIEGRALELMAARVDDGGEARTTVAGLGTATYVPGKPSRRAPDLGRCVAALEDAGLTVPMRRAPLSPQIRVKLNV